MEADLAAPACGRIRNRVAQLEIYALGCYLRDAERRLMAKSKPQLVLVARGQPDRVFRDADKAAAQARVARTALGLDSEFLQRAGRAAGAVALASAASAGLPVVGVRNGEPVVREADGSERQTTWSELGIPSAD